MLINDMSKIYPPVEVNGYMNADVQLAEKDYFVKNREENKGRKKKVSTKP